MNLGTLITFLMSFFIISAYHHHHRPHHRRSRHSRREEPMLTKEQANAMREAAKMLKSELDHNPVLGIPSSIETIQRFLEENMQNVFRLQGVATDTRRSVPWSTLGTLTSSVLRNVMDTLNAKSQMKNQMQDPAEVGDYEEAQRLREIARIMLDIAALLEESSGKKQSPPTLSPTGGLFYPKTHETFYVTNNNNIHRQDIKPFNNPELLNNDNENKVPSVPPAVPVENFVLDSNFNQDFNNKEWQQSKKKVVGVGLVEGNENLISNPMTTGVAKSHAAGLTKEDYFNELSKAILKYQNGEVTLPAADDTNKKFENMKNILGQLRRMNENDND